MIFFFIVLYVDFYLKLNKKWFLQSFSVFSQNLISNHFMQIPSAFCSETIPVEYLYAVLCVFFILKPIHFSNFKQLMIII